MLASANERAIAPRWTGALRQSQRPSASTPPTTSGHRSDPSKRRRRAEQERRRRRRIGCGRERGSRQAEDGRAERGEPQIASPGEQHGGSKRRRQASPADAPGRSTSVSEAQHAWRRVSPRRQRARSRHNSTPRAQARGSRHHVGRPQRARAVRAGQIRERAPRQATPALRHPRPERAGAACGRRRSRPRRRPRRREPRRPWPPRAQRPLPPHPEAHAPVRCRRQRATARRRSTRQPQVRARAPGRRPPQPADLPRPDLRAPIAPAPRLRAPPRRRQPPAAARARALRRRRPHRRRPPPPRRRHRRAGRERRARPRRRAPRSQRAAAPRRRRRAGAAGGIARLPHRASNASLTLSRSAPSPSAARKTSSREAAPWRARKRARLAAVDHDAAMEQHDLVAGGAREVQILGREQDAASARGECRNGLAEDDDRLRVERRRGLVDEDQRRRERERGNRTRLPPEAARERSEPLAAAVVEAECRQRAPRARAVARSPAPQSAWTSETSSDHAQLVEARRLVRDERGRSAGRARARRGSRRRGSSRHRRRAGRRPHGAASSCRSRSGRRARRRPRRARRGRRRRGPRAPPNRLPTPAGDERRRRTGGRAAHGRPPARQRASGCDRQP